MNYILTFLFGILSFFSPCIFPIIPAYFSFITASSLEEIEDSPGIVVIKTIFFVAGFSTIFTLLGATGAAIGKILLEKSAIIMRILGILIVAFGLNFAGIIKTRIFSYEKRFSVKKTGGVFTAFLFGFAFGAGWSPCIGPFLTTALTLAANSETVSQGMILLLLYSAGIGIPLIISAIFLRRFLAFIKKSSKLMKLTEVTSGIILILLGLAMLTGYYSRISYKLSSLVSF